VARWVEAFLAALRPLEVAEPLKAAALAARLKDWTRLLTAKVWRLDTNVGRFEKL
jgi:hypothetical protein